MKKFKITAITAALLLAGVCGAYALNLDSLRIYFLNGDYRACISLGEELLAQQRSSKDLDELYYILGLSYLKDGNYLRASDIFEIILKEYRNSRFKEEAKLGLGDSFYMRRDFRASQAAYEELLKVNSRTKLKPALYFRLSQLGKLTANSRQQQEYLEKLKKEFPQSPEALTNKEFLPGEAAIPVTLAGVPHAETKVPAEPEIIIAPEASKPSAGGEELLSGGYSVQVGAFSSYENAKSLVMKLKNQGYSSYLSESGPANNKKIYKVRVGGYSDKREAKAAEKRLQTQGYPTKIIP